MQENGERRIAALTAALEQANTALLDKIEELSLARRVGDAISHHRAIWSLSSELADAIAETVGCKFVLFYALSRSGSFELQAVSSMSTGSEKFPVSIEESRVTPHFPNNDPIQMNDLAESPAWARDWSLPNTLPSWLCIPLLSQDRLRGILCLSHDAPNVFDERVLRTLMIVVPQIAGAFANIDLCSTLRDSEAEYRSLIRGMQDVVYICDHRWKIVDANPAATDLFGESIIGKTLTELFASPNSASEFVDAVRSLKSVRVFETQLVAAGNERIAAAISSSANGTRYSGTIRAAGARPQVLPFNNSRRKISRGTKTPPEKILIADDEVELLVLLENVFKKLGYTVLCAHNGVEAVEYATDDIRLIILDMMMPEMDGVAALRNIREKIPQVKVLIASGYSSPEKVPILEMLGIEGFVKKPFELNKLATTVRDVLDGLAV